MAPRLMMLAARRRYFCVSTPASLITFAHFLVSLSMKARNCCAPQKRATWS